MKFLAVTFYIKNDTIIRSWTTALKPYLTDSYRIYRAQLKFTGVEEKKWTYLILGELNATIPTLADFSSLPIQEAVIKIEILTITPNSFLPSTTSKQDPLLIIEHINVQTAHLDEFKQIMITNNTPAMKYIIDKKHWCSEFIALETDQVLYQQPTFSEWNQLHLISMRLSAPLRYKRDFNKGLQSVSASDFRTTFERLEKIRTFTYKYKVYRIH